LRFSIGETHSLNRQQNKKITKEENQTFRTSKIFSPLRLVTFSPFTFLKLPNEGKKSILCADFEERAESISVNISPSVNPPLIKNLLSNQSTGCFRAVNKLFWRAINKFENAPNLQRASTI
jgi:hypothetical protein